MGQDRGSWRLLPSEQILWQGTPVRGATRALTYRIGPLLIALSGAISALFGALLYVSELPGAAQLGLVTAYLTLLAIAIWLAPRFLHDDCEYLLTCRRVLWRRGRQQRWIDRQGLSYARVIWSPSVPGVGDLELVRATPYGPLSRKQRLVLHNLRAPDRVLAAIRDAEPSALSGDPELPLIERLDPDESVLWDGAPQGLLLGFRELGTALLGLGVLAVGVRYGIRTTSVIIELEHAGLPVRSWTWLLFVLAIALTASMIAGIGAWLVWRGLIFAHAMGRDTEYIVTTQRVLIRRGRTELSVDRQAIVDVAVVHSSLGCRNLFLILDAPGARALSDSGAMTPFGPARHLVPPVLYGLRDADAVSALLLAPVSGVRAAAA